MAVHAPWRPVSVGEGDSAQVIEPGAAAPPRRPPMGLPRRLAALTALMAILLVLGATEIALWWSARTRLEDFKLESVALANTLASLLVRTAPTGSPAALTQGLEGWSHHRITESQAIVYTRRARILIPTAASGLSDTLSPGSVHYTALAHRSTEVRLRRGNDPGWQVVLPLGSPRPFGVLDVRVSTRRLQDWARLERQRAYLLAFLSALLVALGVAVMTARWVGRPLTALGGAMAGAHGGAKNAPDAPEIGPPEFRELARRYNRMRAALAAREQESASRAMLLTLEERARGLDRVALMHETAASFAHEIGTPLNTVSGHLQLLRDDLEAQHDERGMERVRLLLAQVDRVAGIVRAGLNRGAWPKPFAREVDLNEIVTRMTLFLEPSLSDAGVVARLELSGNGEQPPGPLFAPAAPVLAACDPAMVEQILLNLLKNAIEALSPGDSVTIATGRAEREAFIEVQDDGPGLDAEAESTLFRPFATTKGPSGTGLGLAVSLRLARTLGGDLVRVPSPQGVRWRLSLPLPEPR
ncbi:MAG TPA: ATP-binding protein [Gemmatimonadales bacterium]|jgi:signal transduction histidine kinase|nr:ATP-binding protein [Gemmatimonadales bacterium]